MAVVRPQLYAGKVNLFTQRQVEVRLLVRLEGRNLPELGRVYHYGDWRVSFQTHQVGRRLDWILGIQVEVLRYYRRTSGEVSVRRNGRTQR